MAKQYALKRNGQVETGDVVETTVYQTPRCAVIQSAYGQTLVYRVMSSNNICLLESASPVNAVEYADWFTAKHTKEAA